MPTLDEQSTLPCIQYNDLILSRRFYLFIVFNVKNIINYSFVY